jgi:DNA-binding beta-propeller fold protein YncE
MPIRAAFLLPLFAFLSFLPPQEAAGAPRGRVQPGPAARAGTRLPNGWLLAPAGRLVSISNFPQALALSPDGRYAAATCGSWQGGALDIVELASGVRTQAIHSQVAWLGVTFFANGKRLAVTAGLDNRVDLYDFDSGRAVLSDSIVLGPRWSAGGQYPQGKQIDYGPGAIWPAAIAADDASGRLFVVSRFDSSLRVLDVASRTVIRRVRLPGVPYACLPSLHGRVFVSLWSASRVAVVDTASWSITSIVDVGEHPTDMVESADGRVFVANANEGTVSVVDLARERCTEVITTSLDRNTRSGVTPNGLALDGARHRLYVANADANCLAVVDVSKPGASRPVGFVPTGWYPTAVSLVPRDGSLVVTNAKGTGSSPTTIAPPDTGSWCRYLLYQLPTRGTLSIVPAPTAARLARWTSEVIASVPRPVRMPGSLLAQAAAGKGPIRHVFYIFRENRSYDQVLGDMPLGDGDSSRCLFGEVVTPNAHALAREFVLLDNTYCDADGSADGHNWGMAAVASDYVVKSQGTSPVYDYEGGNPLAYPHGGYLWDACRRQGVSFRSYGEFVFNPADRRDSVRAGLPGLEGHVAPRYFGYDTRVSDLDRYAAWLEEFDRYDRDGGLPQLSIIRLPNDHTEGTCTGRPTPRAFVAENDLALGRMVERISHSRYWKESAVFVIEDDAANGPDHVDAHRTVALLAGPYVRRGALDSHLYTNSSVLRTIELLFGMPPMSAFDAAAEPMESAFTNVPDLQPFQCRPAGVDLTETNVAGAYGQERSDQMDFRVADAAPVDELNEILWRAMRSAPPPAPATGAWTLLASAAGRSAPARPPVLRPRGANPILPRPPLQPGEAKR